MNPAFPLAPEQASSVASEVDALFLFILAVTGLFAIGIWIALFLLLRYASVSSILAAASLPVLAWAFGEPWPVIVFGAAAAVAVLLLHKANLRRLRAGTESRFSLGRRGRSVSAP